MSGLDIAREILAEFAVEIGLDAISLNEKDEATLSIGTLEVTIRYDDAPIGRLTLFADLGEIGQDDDAPSFLLTLAYAGWMNGALTVAADQRGERAIGFIALPVMTLTENRLREGFQGLVRAALRIRDDLAAHDYGSAASLAAGEEAMAPAEGVRV